MPGKIRFNLTVYVLAIMLLFAFGAPTVFGKTPQKNSPAKIQIYYSGAQSGYLEPCG